MTRQSTKMFGIDTIEEYLKFCAAAVADLQKDQDNVVRGFAAILALNHVPDWLQYKLTVSDRAALGLPGSQVGECVRSHFYDQNTDLKRLRDIANGFKHLRSTHSTEVIAGYGCGPHGVGPFGGPYLLIDLGSDLPDKERWDVGMNLCNRTLKWWEEKLSTLTTGKADNA